jgi:hypothetical protein
LYQHFAFLRRKRGLPPGRWGKIRGRKERPENRPENCAEKETEKNHIIMTEALANPTPYGGKKSVHRKTKEPIYLGILMWMLDCGHERWRTFDEIREEVSVYLKKRPNMIEIGYAGVEKNTKGIDTHLRTVMGHVTALFPSFQRQKYARKATYRFVLPADLAAAHAHIRAQYDENQTRIKGAPIKPVTFDVCQILPSQKPYEKRVPTYFMYFLWILEEGWREWRSLAEVQANVSTYCKQSRAIHGTSFSSETVRQGERLARDVNNYFPVLLIHKGNSLSGGNLSNLCLYVLPLELACAHMRVAQELAPPATQSMSTREGASPSASFFSK